MLTFNVKSISFSNMRIWDGSIKYLFNTTPRNLLYGLTLHHNSQWIPNNYYKELIEIP